MRLIRFFVLALLLALPAGLHAQNAFEGEYPGLETGKMWTFDALPMEYWAKRYNFTPTDSWIEHVRLSAVRMSSGCSASFVSGQGVVMSNHHCVRACIEAATRPGEDLMNDGFYAARREDERACPGLSLDQLQEITDVTGRVGESHSPKADAKTASVQRAKAIKAIEEECKAGSAETHCQVVTMYRGGQYKLYRFHRYSDVRLVFAPEDHIAFYGGDPDNYVYPRYDLDMSFVRAYVDGKPAETPHHYKWSPDGTKEGDLTFVIGNPGSTGRLETYARLEYLRDVQYPAQLNQLNRMLAVYYDLSRSDEARAKALRNPIFSAANIQKRYVGYLNGLRDPALMAQKKAWETQFRAAVNAKPELKSSGAAWKTVADITARRKAIDVRRRYHSGNAYNSRLMTLALGTVRYPAEMAKPDADRLAPYQEANKAAIERTLFTDAPIDAVQEKAVLAAFFTAMQAELPATDPVLKQALQGRTPEAAAAALVDGTALAKVDARKALTDAGVAAVAGSTDVFIQLARVIDPLERAIAKEVADLNDREAQANEKINRALLAVYGNSVAPDATFSLRISDGEVKRYPMNGTFAAPYTTYGGLYERARGFAEEPPFNLPPRWKERRNLLDMDTPFNAVSTNDIIGGNSGSPVINKDAEIVGLIFDGNIEQLANQFLFTERVSRSVWVDSRAIVHSLRRVYDAGGLAAELESSQKSSSGM